MKAFSIVYIWRPTRLGVTEGLNVLLTELIKGLVAQDVRVRIFTTGRHVASLRNVLRINGVDETAVSVRVLTAGSRAMDTAQATVAKRSRLAPLVDGLRRLGLRRDHFDRALSWLLDYGPLSFFPKLVLAIIVASVLVVVSPVILLLLVAVVLKRMLRYTLARSKPLAARWLPGLARRYKLYREHLIGDDFSIRMQEQFYRRECLAFAKQLLRQEDADRLFFAAAFDGTLIEALQARKTIVTFPDAVTAAFPSRYPSTPHTSMLMRNIAKSVRAASGVICYSEYSRDTQLAPILKGRARGPVVAVIPQGFHIETETDDPPEDLNSFVRNYFPQFGDAARLQFGSFPYVLYPSVDRPHKNALTLVRAVEYLLRKKYVPIKLIMTSPGPSADTHAYLARRKLHRDIIFMPGLPVRVLNRVIKYAAVVVHPSLAEGGDIFNFSRAVSNSCPALLGDIPVAREMFDRHGVPPDQYSPWLFDPFDHLTLADRISTAIAERGNLLALQSRVFGKVSSYRFEDMARRYYDFYMSV